GQIMRLPYELFRQASTRAGRKYCRLAKGDEVVAVELVQGAETLFVATKNARVLHFRIEEVPVLGGAGKGVRGIRLDSGDEVLGMVQLSRPGDTMRVKNENDKVLGFGQTKYQVTSRGGRGVKTSARVGFCEILRQEIELVDWSTMEDGAS
ncbi:MAG: DNA gyrase C-terminal beta-propeller domain-containing protein, partial [Planctomycetaceae bacterium]